MEEAAVEGEARHQREEAVARVLGPLVRRTERKVRGSKRVRRMPERKPCERKCAASIPAQKEERKRSANEAMRESLVEKVQQECSLGQQRLDWQQRPEQ